VLPMCPVRTSEGLVRPRGFEPLTFCSGGNMATSNLLIFERNKVPFERSPAGSSEKLPGKLRGTLARAAEAA
jgi:hypothetical protein